MIKLQYEDPVVGALTAYIPVKDELTTHGDVLAGEL
jgi:hypothetical protein